MKHKHDKHTADIEDIFVWPSGEWCYRYEKDEFTHTSDDYSLVVFGTKEYDTFLMNLKGTMLHGR